MSLFNNIDGKCGEDITTEIIAWMLRSNNYFTPFQKLFYSRILNRIQNSTQLHAEIVTQPSTVIGRPDMIINTLDSVIIIEIKLGAYLSGDDQLLRYCEVFYNESFLNERFTFNGVNNKQNKILAMLAPRNTIDLSLNVSDCICNKKHNMSFERWCENKDIRFIPIPWEEVLSDLDLNDSLQKELYSFVKGYIHQELNEEEIMILKDTNIPSALNKLFKNISAIRDHLSILKYKTGRMAQSYNYYGFAIEFKDFSCFFGYCLQPWITYHTPVFLQIKKDWIKCDQIQFFKSFPLREFENDELEEYIRPFKIDSIDNWKDELEQLLAKFKNMSS